MTVAWYALSLAIAVGSSPPVASAAGLPWAGGRVYTSESCEVTDGACWHVGVRPHADVDGNGDWGLAVTVQVTERGGW